jgi:hypothetical protein
MGWAGARADSWGEGEDLVQPKSDQPRSGFTAVARPHGDHRSDSTLASQGQLADA